MNGLGGKLTDRQKVTITKLGGELATGRSSAEAEHAWADLVAAVAWAPYEKPLSVEAAHFGAATTFAVTPRTTEKGDVDAQAQIRGSFVFDPVEGMLVRLEVDSVTIDTTVASAGRSEKRKVRGSAVIQFSRN